MGLINLLKLAAVLLCVWLLYRGVQSLLSGRGGRAKARPRAGAGPRRNKPPATKQDVIDDLVYDPGCETYLPRHEALRTVVDGQEMFFCDTECRDKFLAKRKAQ